MQIWINTQIIIIIIIMWFVVSSPANGASEWWRSGSCWRMMMVMVKAGYLFPTFMNLIF